MQNEMVRWKAERVVQQVEALLVAVADWALSAVQGVLEEPLAVQQQHLTIWQFETESRTSAARRLDIQNSRRSNLDDLDSVCLGQSTFTSLEVTLMTENGMGRQDEQCARHHAGSDERSGKNVNQPKYPNTENEERSEKARQQCAWSSARIQNIVLFSFAVTRCEHVQAA